MIELTDALLALRPEGGYTIWEDESIEYFGDSENKPTLEEIKTKQAELEVLEPMRVLRIQRTVKLEETDWMGNQDVIISDEWKAYRQALRDLPSTADPKLEEFDILTNVIWPTEPE
jgi:hypothetical protein